MESAQVQVTVWIGGRVRGEMYCVQLQQSTSDDEFMRATCIRVDHLPPLPDTY